MTLISNKEPDNFKSESPIRAFTSFEVSGRYAIGKGFRPSMHHLARYLDAMSAKEGWKLLQVIEADAPTMIFERQFEPLMTVTPPWPRTDLYRGVVERYPDFLNEWKDRDHEDYGDCDPVMPELRDSVPDGVYWSDSGGNFYNSTTRRGMGTKFYQEWCSRRAEFPQEPIDPIIDESSMLKIYPHQDMLVKDDPINPKHYAGTACAEIGELLTANSYQILKYNWRLGEKDNPCIELGKALWYLDREIRHRSSIRVPGKQGTPKWDWIIDRLEGKDDYVEAVTKFLYQWNMTGVRDHLYDLQDYIKAKLDSYNGCTEWGRGLQP